MNYLHIAFQNLYVKIWGWGESEGVSEHFSCSYGKYLLDWAYSYGKLFRNIMIPAFRQHCLCHVLNETTPCLNWTGQSIITLRASLSVISWHSRRHAKCHLPIIDDMPMSAPFKALAPHFPPHFLFCFVTFFCFNAGSSDSSCNRGQWMN